MFGLRGIVVAGFLLVVWVIDFALFWFCVWWVSWLCDAVELIVFGCGTAAFYGGWVGG